MRIRKRLFFATMVVVSGIARTAEVTVDMHAVTDTGIGDSLGKVVISEAAHGLVLTPTLTGLPPGAHGFHVHEDPDCAPAMDAEGKAGAALAAGPHLDPQGGHHGAPYDEESHLGDLPTLMVDVSGRANTAVDAPRLSMMELDNRALIIHMGGDNYSDKPVPLGGGGIRIACGIIDSPDFSN